MNSLPTMSIGVNRGLGFDNKGRPGRNGSGLDCTEAQTQATANSQNERRKTMPKNHTAICKRLFSRAQASCHQTLVLQPRPDHFPPPRPNEHSL